MYINAVHIQAGVWTSQLICIEVLGQAGGNSRIRLGAQRVKFHVCVWGGGGAGVD